MAERRHIARARVIRRTERVLTCRRPRPRGAAQPNESRRPARLPGILPARLSLLIDRDKA